ncbi:hypothetical protein [Vibrio tapetis]|nr:hypothetical protein [Vibrio tapetis]
MTPERGVSLVAKIPTCLHAVIAKFTATLIHKTRCDVAYKGLEKAFPSIRHTDKQRLSRTSAYNQLMSLFRWLHIDKQNIQAEGVNEIKHAASERQGGIVLSLHLGIADAPTWVLNQNGIETKTIVGAGSDGNNKESQWVAALLEHRDCPYISRSDNFIVQAIQNINHGCWLMFHCDMNAPGEKHTFFTHPTQIPAIGIQLAMLSNTPIYFSYGWQDGDIYRTKFTKFETKENFEQSVSHLVEQMETTIRSHPEHWIWHYNRWK